MNFKTISKYEKIFIDHGEIAACVVKITLAVKYRIKLNLIKLYEDKNRVEIAKIT